MTKINHEYSVCQTDLPCLKYSVKVKKDCMAMFACISKFSWSFHQSHAKKHGEN